MVGAGENRRYRFKTVRLGGRHKQTRPGKGKDISFTFRQRGKVSFCKLHSRDNGVVVGYLFAVQNAGNLRRKGNARHKGQLAA